MTTLIYPPPPTTPSTLTAASLARELQWYLSHLHTTILPSLKSGLTECDALLSPASGAHTLVLSSLRSESIKGTVTRTGTRLIKGDVAIKLSSAPPPRGRDAHRMTINTAPDAPTLALEPLVRVRNLISAALDVIDVTMWTGDRTDAGFARGQLQLLYEHVQEAKAALKGTGSASAIEPSRPATPNPGSEGVASRPRTPAGFSRPQSPMKVPSRVVTPAPVQQETVNIAERPWNEDVYEEGVFEPACAGNVSFHLTIADAALVLQVRALERADAPPSQDSITGLGIRERLGLAARPQTHEEIGQVFAYKGEEVRVKEKLRVASQDPSLLSAMAKLGALEHSVAASRWALDTVMERRDE